MQHEAEIEELERAAAIRGAELAKLNKARKSKVTSKQYTLPRLLIDFVCRYISYHQEL